MEDERIGFSVSPDRGKPIGERLGTDAGDASEWSRSMGRELVKDLEAGCDDNREHDSLRSLMWRSNMLTLTYDLTRNGIPKASLRGKKKADIVDLVMDELMPGCLDDFMFAALPLGSAFIRHLRDLVATGGRKVVAKQDVVRGKARPIWRFPNIMGFNVRRDFVERVPQEALDLMVPVTDEVWDEYERLADICVEFGDYLKCAADLSGIVPIQEVAEEWAKDKGLQLEGLLQRVIRRVEVWADLVLLRIIVVDSVSYAVGYDFYELHKLYGGSLNMEDVDHLIGEHQKVDRRPVEERYLAGNDLAECVLDTPEAKELIDLLDQHVPDTTDSSDFAVDTVAELYLELRDGEDDAATCIDGILAEDEEIRATGALAAQIHRASERLNRVIPKWHLNGWSLAELAQREGRELTEIDAEGSACEEPSGYVYIEEDDEDDDDSFYFDGDEQMWTALRDNDESDHLAYDLYKKDESYEKYLSGDVFDDEVWRVFDEENEAYLEEFGTWMEDAGLRKGAIREHTGTVDYFLTTYVSHYVQVPMRFGAYLARAYLGSYFIRKAARVAPTVIKSVAKSLTKFYECMLDVGHIERKDYDYLVKDIEDHLDEWCDLCDEYINP